MRAIDVKTASTALASAHASHQCNVAWTTWRHWCSSHNTGGGRQLPQCWLQIGTAAAVAPSAASVAASGPFAAAVAASLAAVGPAWGQQVVLQVVPVQPLQLQAAQGQQPVSLQPVQAGSALT